MEASSQDLPQLLFEDEHLLALNKPCGLLSVPGKGEAGRINLTDWAHQRWGDVRPVHRLDMHTSGLIVFARHLDAQRRMNAAFSNRQVHKRYLAWVWGRPVGDSKPAPASQTDALPSGEVDLPLICDWPNRPRQMVCHERGKPAQTQWHVLQRDPTSGHSLMDLRPITGRSHQLRVHMQAIGHPILGDDLYAHPQALAAAPRLMLHAMQLELPHPFSGQALHLLCPPPFSLEVAPCVNP